jgi:hypothetical protein
MDMVNTSNTLQTHPVLKPHNPLPRFINTDVCIFRQGRHKLPLNKLLNNALRFSRHIASNIIYSNRRPRPDKNMLDTGFESIRPVVQQDRIISAIFKRYRRMVCERVCRDRLIDVSGRPSKPFLDNEIRDASVRFLGLERPAEVFVQIGREAFELF